MIRGIFVTVWVSLLFGCARTSLDTSENHPANPSAATPASPEIPPTLRPGFDPHGDEPAEQSSEGHQHHHHHDHGHEQHQHGPGAIDGGAQ